MLRTCTPTEDLAQRIADVTSSLPWLVWEEGGTILGARLYKALIADLRKKDLHALIGGAALPNPVSAAEIPGLIKRLEIGAQEAGCLGVGRRLREGILG